MRQLIAGNPRCCKVDHQVEILIIVSSRVMQHTRGQKTRPTLGVIHSDKPRGRITMSPIAKHPTYYMHSLQESKSPDHSPQIGCGYIYHKVCEYNRHPSYSYHRHDSEHPMQGFNSALYKIVLRQHTSMYIRRSTIQENFQNEPKVKMQLSKIS